MASYRYEICDEKTINELMKFINIYWKKGHIFTRSQILFNWQHKLQGCKYSFVLTFDNANNEIVGVLGFILTSQYSTSLHNQREAWLAIWQTSPKLKSPGVGVGMLNFLIKTFKLLTICAFGIAERVVHLYKILNFRVSTLNHHVLINPQIQNYNILKPGKWKPDKFKFNNNEYTLKKIDRKSILDVCKKNSSNIFVTGPLKNAEYILNRYANHPIYSYNIYSILKHKICVGILVTRKIIVKKSTIIRIIDYQGKFDHFSYLNIALSKMLEEHNSEYLDFMQFGMPKEILEGIGFVDVYSVEEMVVPDHFSPYKQKNIILDYAYKTENTNRDFLICKGDSDQDRPS